MNLRLECTVDRSVCMAFRPVPDVVQGSGNITIQVSNTANEAVLDYERTQRINLTVSINVFKC